MTQYYTPSLPDPDAFRLLIEQLADEGLFVVAADGRILSWNRGASRITGYSLDEVLDRSLDCLFESPFWANVQADSLSARQNLKRKDGTLLEAEIRIARLNAHTRAGDFGVALRAVDDLRQTDAEAIPAAMVDEKPTDRTFARDDLRYHAFVDHATDAMFLHVPDGCIVDINPQACESLGYSREELIGQTPLLFDIDVDAEQIVERVKTLNPGETVAFDSRHRRKDGTIFPVAIRVRPFAVAGRQFALALARDITDRKTIEAELHANSERYRLALEAAEMGTWKHDLVTDELWLDERCQAHHGVSQPRLTPSELLALVHPDDLERVYAQIATVHNPHSGTEGSSIDVRILPGDGTVRWLTIRARANFEEQQGERRPTLVIGTTLDITERKLAEERLVASERRFRELADAIPQIVWTATPDGSLDHLNARAVEYTGIGEHELTGWSWERVIHPDDLSGTLESWGEILQTAVPRDVEFRIRRADGLYRWHVTRTISGRDQHGAVARWYGTCTDIEDLKQAVAALRESEARYRDLVELAPEGIAIVQQGRFVYANQAAAKLAGVKSPAVMIGTLLADYMHPDDVSASAARQETVLVTDQPVPLRQFRLRRPDGDWTVLESCAGPCRHNGQPAIQLIARDVSERTRTELALRESEERFRQIATAIEHVFWMVSFPDIRVLYVSSAYELIWGRKVDNLYADPAFWLEGIAAQDRQGVQEHYDRWLRDPVSESFEVEYRVVRPDGEIRWVFDRGIAIRDEHGAVHRLTGVAQDITEKKLLETQFRQAQKMEAVGQLAGGIAHDFNNLLMVVSGFSELLLEDRNCTDAQREAVGAIRDAGTRAAGLTRQLLAFSRKQLLEPVTLDLNEVVRQSESMMRRVIRENVEVIVRLAGDLQRIKADSAQIDQVLLNLVLNARDAMPAGGRLTIETDNVEEPPGLQCVRLRVSDNGAGMTEAVRAKIFEPFFTTKPVGQGTGLGMAVVHGIVSQSGGQIRVESEVGCGTTVELLLPVTQSPLAAQTLDTHPAAKVRGAETILLAEDEPAVRRIVRRSLELQGYTVLEAEHGASALEVASRHAGTIHLLLTDVVMPQMSGRQLSDILRARRPGLRVLYMSGYTDDESLQHSLDNTAILLLHKPFDPDALVKKVREVLDQGPPAEV